MLLTGPPALRCHSITVGFRKPDGMYLSCLQLGFPRVTLAGDHFVSKFSMLSLEPAKAVVAQSSVESSYLSSLYMHAMCPGQSECEANRKLFLLSPGLSHSTMQMALA